MKCVTLTLFLMIGAGCGSQVADVSGNWYLAGYGCQVTLKQNGDMIKGTLIRTDGADGLLNIAIEGRAKGDIILLDFEPHGTLSMPLHYKWCTSPKGNKQFLKCMDNAPLSLIPDGMRYFQYDILKEEFRDLERLSEERRRSHQPDGAVEQFFAE